MKKVFFLTLFLMIFGAVSVKAQVRIGGNGAPHGAAVLDLNTDDTNNGTKTLALPRVRLASTTDDMGNAALLGGMLVYNTAGGSLSEGVYYWDGSQWVKPNSTAYSGSTSITLSGNSFQRTALTGDVTAEANSNATTIADNAVTSAKIQDGAIGTGHLADASITSGKIADGTIVGADLNGMNASAGQVLGYDGAGWAPVAAGITAGGSAVKWAFCAGYAATQCSVAPGADWTCGLVTGHDDAGTAVYQSAILSCSRGTATVGYLYCSFMCFK